MSYKHLFPNAEEVKFPGAGNVVLLRPLSFMNRSGAKNGSRALGNSRVTTRTLMAVPSSRVPRAAGETWIGRIFLAGTEDGN